MICVIDGFKYDTDKSDLIVQIQLNKTDVCYLYRNSKLKYFYTITELIDISTGELRERCVPISKDEAKDFLTSHNKVKEYELHFGELPEAEGEDYIAANTEYLPYEERTESTNNGSTNNECSNNRLHSKYNLRQTLRLTSAIKRNDYAAAESAILKHAKTKPKHLSYAVLRQNTEIVSLLLECDLKASYEDISNSILLEDLTLFNLLLKDNELKRYEYGALKRYADKYMRTVFSSLLAELMK